MRRIVPPTASCATASEKRSPLVSATASASAASRSDDSSSPSSLSSVERPTSDRASDQRSPSGFARAVSSASWNIAARRVDLLPEVRRPRGDEQRPRQRPRIPEPARRVERVVEQLGRALGVAQDRELDVAEEPRGLRPDREVAVAELQRAFEHRDRGLELAEPVADLAEAREDPRLAEPPPAFGAGELQRAPVVLLGRLHVRTLARDVAGVRERVDRAFGERAVARVEVERGEGRLLEVERDRARAPGRRLRVAREPVGHQQVQALALALGEALVRDVAHHAVAEAPDARAGRRRARAAPPPRAGRAPRRSARRPGRARRA